MLVPLASIGVNRTASTEWSLCARTASATTIAVSPALNATGGGAVLAVEVGDGRGVGLAVDAGFGVAGDDCEGVGVGTVGEGLATGTTGEARGVDSAVADGSAVRPAAIEVGGACVEMTEPAGEHAASASTSTSLISCVRPVTCLTSELGRRE
jgi:hypothetical protein